MSKILEKVVGQQLGSHLHSYNTYSVIYSGFIPHHSPEKALVKVINDPLIAAHTTDHSILLDGLQNPVN